jgi:hypothetical protein
LNLSNVNQSPPVISLSNRYKVISHCQRVATRSPYTLPLYAGRIQQPQSLKFNNEKDIHSFQGLKRQIKKTVVVIVSSALIAHFGANTAYAASYSVDHLKLYAHSRILDYKEFQCFNKIITKESRWSYTARNGSHYGLGQMRSEYYRDLDPYRQIDSSLRYITKRYKSSCKALQFHNLKGYY